MTTAVMKFISEAMESEGIPYEFMEFTSPVADLQSYWVGEYSEIPPNAEDGMQETQLIITGTGRGSWLNLEKEKVKIEKIFPTIGGRTAILDNGSGVAVFYGNAFPVPTGDGFLKRLQVNLVVKEWKVK
nr:MAG TPA: hypothetical protein [Caudoviricetes sp.]